MFGFDVKESNSAADFGEFDAPSSDRAAPDAPKCTKDNCRDGQYYNWNERAWKPCLRCLGKGVLSPIDERRTAAYTSAKFTEQRHQVRIARSNGIGVRPKWMEAADYEQPRHKNGAVRRPSAVPNWLK